LRLEVGQKKDPPTRNLMHNRVRASSCAASPYHDNDGIEHAIVLDHLG